MIRIVSSHNSQVKADKKEGMYYYLKNILQAKIVYKQSSKNTAQHLGGETFEDLYAKQSIPPHLK